MAMDMGDRGQILSCDVHPYKVKLIESGAQRLGLTCIRAATADAPGEARRLGGAGQCGHGRRALFGAGDHPEKAGYPL